MMKVLRSYRFVPQECSGSPRPSRDEGSFGSIGVVQELEFPDSENGLSDQNLTKTFYFSLTSF